MDNNVRNVASSMMDGADGIETGAAGIAAQSDAPSAVPNPAVPTPAADAPAFHIPPTALFDLGQMEVRWAEAEATLWAFCTPEGRPNYSTALLKDILTWQEESRRIFDKPGSPLKYMVLGSRFPGVYNLGGDLELFAGCIMRQDREALQRYGHLCIETVYNSWHCNDMNVVNIALAQGDALGGGLEALLTFDVIIAERHAKFGLPEILFGLFPGMGAMSLLARRMDIARAQRLILTGKICTADEMFDMGLVDMVVETGEGEQAVRDYIASNSARHNGHVAAYRAARRVNRLTREELIDIVENWVDAALRLTKRDIKMMQRLAAAQTRLHNP